MRIGKLDRKITIQFRSISQNDYGEAVAAFSSSASVWAMIETQPRGKEKVNNGIETSQQSVNFLIRYSSDVDDVTSGDRVLYNSQYYDIESVQEVGRNLSLRLICNLVE
jgi:SPP1 family predicted phage head-tail adaptor